MRLAAPARYIPQNNTNLHINNDASEAAIAEDQTTTRHQPVFSSTPTDASTFLRKPLGGSTTRIEEATMAFVARARFKFEAQEGQPVPR